MASLEKAWTGSAGLMYYGNLLLFSDRWDVTIAQDIIDISNISAYINALGLPSPQDSAGNAGDDSSIARYVLHNTVSVYLDSPSTTSSTTYKWQTSVYSSRTHYFFVPPDTGGNTSHTAPATITLMEIAG